MAKKKATANGVMKKRDLARFRDGLKAVGDYKGIKFAYAVVKTLRLVEVELADLAKSNKWSAEYEEFEKKRQELVMKYAKKDKDGNPVTFQDGGTVKAVLNDPDACNAAVDELKEKYSEAVKVQEEQDKEFEKSLEEPAEVKIHTIPEDIVPKDISAKHLQGIFELVK